MSAIDHYKAGELNEAIAAATADVKAKPTDRGARGFLCELLCFAGDLERADKQLDALGQLDPDSLVGVALFRQLIRGEQARQQFYNEGRVPEFLDQPTPDLQLHLQASVLIRDGNLAAASRLLDEAEEQRPALCGELDGRPFSGLRDVDDLNASFFEVLTSTGKYYWIPMDRVELLEFKPFEHPRDLLWRRAHMIVRNGPDGEVYLPTLYPGAAAHADPQIRLGRMTQWRGEDSEPVRGSGQRIYLVGEEDIPILELTTLQFAE